MLYVTNSELPERFTTDQGYNLCLLWFLTSLGYDVNKETLEDFDHLVEKNLKITKISSYKLVSKGEGEILFYNNSYHVGDGFGNPIYSPCRDYGNFKIERKYSVKFK